MDTLIEQRKETRTNLSWPVSVWLPEASRFCNGHSANVSRTGAFFTVPMTMPIRVGHSVEINFPRTASLAEEKGGYSRIKSGKVVRIERQNILKDANAGVAIHFE